VRYNQGLQGLSAIIGVQFCYLCPQHAQVIPCAPDSVSSHV
jgi:hypothetical protein